ncbi:uncharacterized protein YALI1_A02977g [Yarrowia lipolytica]|uniref:Uncharacterized protein n=1 Tax=Yarrowia lipolytica TaxID=4952 RepID=A0A1D8N3G7_YARLL|nr:hypothetical protein YALI1_A02977g [Yarrowia lipolytica]
MCTCVADSPVSYKWLLQSRYRTSEALPHFSLHRMTSVAERHTKTACIRHLGSPAARKDRQRRPKGSFFRLI